MNKNTFKVVFGIGLLALLVSVYQSAAGQEQPEQEYTVHLPIILNGQLSEPEPTPEPEPAKGLNISIMDEWCIEHLGDDFPVDSEYVDNLEYTQYLQDELANYFNDNYDVSAGSVRVELCVFIVPESVDFFSITQHETAKSIVEDDSIVRLNLYVWDEFLDVGDHLEDFQKAINILAEAGHITEK